MIKVAILSAFASVFDLVGISLLYPYFLIIFDEVDLTTSTGQLLQSLWLVYPILMNNYFLTFLIIAIIFLSYLLRHVMHKSVIQRGHLIGLMMSKAVAEHLLYDEYSEIRKISRSKATAILSAKINNGVFSVIIPCAMIISASSFILFTIFFGLIVEPILFIYAIGFISSIYCALFLILKTKMKRISVTTNEFADYKINALNEIISAMKLIRFYRYQNRFVKNFLKIDRKLREAQASLQFINVISKAQIETAIILMGILVLYFISKGKSSTEIIFINLSMILIFAQKFLGYSQQIYNNSVLVIGNMKDFEEVVKIALVRKDVLNESQLYDISMKNFTKLQLNKICYKGDGQLNILNSVCLDIDRGDKIAIIGKSGSGKSTLLNIMLGLLMPSSGSVSLNNGKYELSMLHCFSSVLTQDVYINDGSIKDVINYYTENGDNLSDNLISDFLPDLLNPLSESKVILNEEGLNISGGQRQRVALCQALARSPQILFIDEGTSDLDVEAQENILKSLSSDPKLTVVSITHRLETLDYFDKVYELKDGNLIILSDKL